MEGRKEVWHAAPWHSLAMTQRGKTEGIGRAELSPHGEGEQCHPHFQFSPSSPPHCAGSLGCIAQVETWWG